MNRSRAYPRSRGGTFVTCDYFRHLRAYPRSRGGTPLLTGVNFGARGLSPLARGNLKRIDLAGYNRGPIPARAGEPGQGRKCLIVYMAYPRSRGGTSYT